MLEGLVLSPVTASNRYSRRENCAVSCSPRRCGRAGCESDAASLGSGPGRGRNAGAESGRARREARCHLAQRQASRPRDGACLLEAVQPTRRVLGERGLQPTDPTNWIVDAMAGESGHPARRPFSTPAPAAWQADSGNPEADPVDFPLNGIVALEEADGKWLERWRLKP